MLTRSSLRAGADLPPIDVVFGRSPSMLQLRQRFELIARTPFPVLITGESGTGKEVFARLIHSVSCSPSAPFIKVNCPAIPAGLLESDLFGHERGAFTGATNTKPGRIELAHGGVLFLDEIGDLDPSLQAKLLQVLQDGTFFRLGGCEPRRVRTRIISATNRDLYALVRAGAFRQDLYHRMNALHIHLPPLRARAVDIPMLVDYFLSIHERDGKKPVGVPSRELMRRMRKYSWPGNIRELQNAVRRYAAFGSEESIIADLSAIGSHASWTPDIYIKPNVSLKQITKDAIRDLERLVIFQALQRNDWNRKKSARTLGISDRSLFYKMRSMGFGDHTVIETEAEGEQRVTEPWPEKLNS